MGTLVNSKLKVGLLICDHVQAKYVDDFGDYNDMFAKLFPSIEFENYDVCKGDFPIDLNDCDFYMCTGSKYSVYENLDWITKLKTFISELYQKKKYFIGFCFGHQLIAEALDGKVERAQVGWCVGNHQFEMVEKTSWMVPALSNLNMLMSCQDQILELPNESVVLATNDFCPNAMILVGERFLGFQGHPEFTPKYSKLLIESRIDQIGKTKALHGLKSLGNKLNNHEIQSWILNFIDENIDSQGSI